MSNLRPAWSNKAGRGFQPPPTVTSERAAERGRSTSFGSHERSGNKFAALDSDDEDAALAPNSNGDKQQSQPSGNTRSEAFKSSFHRQTSAGSRGGGRSLADLAATVPEGASSAGRRGSYEGGRGGARFSGLKSESEAKVIRFTREKLLSMRPPSNATSGLPPALKHLEGNAVLSEAAQDPVCWDTFEPEEIWASFSGGRRSSTGMAPAKAGTGIPQNDERRRSTGGGGGGRWQRGVALPPPEEGGSRRREKESDNPNDLWDDPIGGANGAAADFSAFGDMPTDDGAFDFDKMAEESRKLEEELRGTVSGGVDLSQGNNGDAKRPLAAAGTTIMSGSGDDVNVFEDFDEPGTDQPSSNGVGSGAADPSASSRLMEMIGVNKDHTDGEIAKEASLNPWGSSEEASKPDNSSISLNPWGTSTQGQSAGGLLGAFAAGTNAQSDADILRQRQEEERQRIMAQQREAEERARQQQAAAMQQQQQSATQQSQVELVLMERICTMLEKTWGRSDLVSILTTLHSEDSRVIPLLNNVDSLRALIARSPQRVALRRDPSFPGEMAVLLITNAQWQQQQQQQQAQQQEMQKRLEMQRQQEQAARPAPIDADAPWFYSDPQGNIQGPFRGEEMRQWLEAGYFKGDLPISQQSRGPFHPLSSLFRDLSSAFQVPDMARQNSEAQAKAAAEEEARRIQQEEERERIARAQREQAEAEAAAVAAERARQETGANNSSMQLKGMLGLAGSTQPEAQAPQPVEEPVEEKKAPKKASKAQNKKSQQKPVEETPVESEDPQVSAKPAAPAWGGAANSKPQKSMAQIQQEEARAAAIQAAQNPGRSNTSGWANVAATGKSGWGGEIKTAPSTNPAVTGPRPVQARAPVQAAGRGTGNVASSAAQRSTSTASSTPAEEFGTSMSPTLEKWCKEQMQKINGSDDLTLVAFCMTLTDASEIRQYLTTYLGSTAQVNNFATEFIGKRGLGPKQQEDWETTNTKKGRKKKVGK